MEQVKKEKGTAVAVKQGTKDRLQSHMHYGETIDGMINKLLDSYESVKNKGLK